MNNGRVLQAYELGLVQGTSKVTFSPRLEVTREQMALMLFNTLKKAGFAAKLTDGQADTRGLPIQTNILLVSQCDSVAEWEPAYEGEFV